MRKLYSFVFALLFYVMSFGQSVSIGSGTVTNAISPWDSYYGYSYVQTLYLASEINASGNITSITFDFAGATLGNSDSITIFMGNTSKNLFSSTTDWVPVSSMTQVYKDILSTSTLPGPVTITLTTPFPYNGTGNLIIAIDENKPNYDAAVRFKGTLLTGSNRVIYNRSDVTNPDPLAPPIGTMSSTVANIIIDGLVGASCQGVSGVSMSNITATTATGSWTAPAGGNSPTGYNWEVRTSGLPGSGATGLVVSGNSITTDANITGLISATTDTFYVRSVCGVGSFGPWSSGIGFVTLCGSTNVPYSVNFEGSTTTFPLCTGVENVGTGNIWTILNNPGYGFTSNTLRYAYNFTNPADTWFYTQGLNLTAGVSYRLSFKYGNNSSGTGGYVESLEVKYGSSPAAASMSDLVVDYPSISIAGSANSVTDFTPATTGVYYFGFHAYSISNQDQLYVDDISMATTPTCDVPTAITQSSITSTGMLLDWTAPALGTPTAYDLYYSTSNTAPVGTTTPTVAGINGTTKILTGLVTATKYYFYLRTVCGTSGNSNWTSIDSFVTLCDAINIPYSVNFEGSTSFPLCTAVENAGTGNIWTIANNPGYGFTSNTLRYAYNSANPANTWFYTQGLNLTAGVSYRLSFKYGNNSSGAGGYVESLEVKYGSSPAAASMSDLVVDYPSISIAASANSLTDFTPTTTGIYYLGFHAYSIADQDALYVDDITMAVTPTCDLPTAIIQSNVTSTGIQLDWTAPSLGNPTAYDLYYSTSNTAPVSTTTPTVTGITGNTKTLIGLVAATKYYFYLRTVCGTSGTSDWTAIDSFTTTCVAISTLNENFDAVTVPSLPTCWSKILRGSSLSAFAYVTTTAANANSAPNAVTMYNSSSTTTDDIILVSPPLSNVGAGTYQLTFFAKNSTAAQDIEVGTLDNNSSTAVFTPLQSVDIATTFQKYAVSFSGYSGTDQFIGIRVINASTFSYAYIDNVVWELIPSCVEPSTIVASNIMSSTAQIDWTAPSSGSPVSYDVYYNSTNTSPTGTTTPSIAGVSGTTANLSGLSSSTNYYVWVRSNCGTGGMSSWSPAYTFATACGVVTAPTAAPQTFVTAISPPLCWSRAQGLLTTPVTFSSTATSGWVIDDYLNVTTPVNKCIKINIYGTARKEWLMTPSYDLGTGGNLQMEFDIALTNWNGTAATTLGSDDKAVVLISIDNGVTWDPVNALRTWDATTAISNTGEHIIIPLSSYSGTVMFAFYGESTVTNADNDLFIDNFEIKPQTIFPVQLMSFAGYKKDGLNQLSWNTASEQGNKGFEVERSIDGIHFTSVGFASSKAINGNSNGILEYKFTDERTFNATMYYRLKQVNLDGRSKYSNIVTIKGIKVAEVVLSAIFPNPVSRVLNIIISSPEKENLTIVITDLAGKSFLRKSMIVELGENKVNMNVEALSSGTYIIKSICQNGCESAVQKFIKQ